MQLFEHAPSPNLRPFIRRFLVVEFPSLHHDAHLPDICPVAAFSFRGKCQLDGHQWVPAAAFTGLHETLRTHAHSHGHAVLLATFTPTGAAAFLRPPLEEFTGTTANLADILDCPEALNELHEQLAEAPSHTHRVKLLENFLLKRLRISSPDPLVTAAVTWLEQAAGTKRIDDLTRYIGLSQSALERRFRRVIGISPKKLASMVRLQHAIRLRATGADLTATAHAAGYFDQSHFIKDFRRATGSTPDAFFRQKPSHKYPRWR